MCSRSVRSRGRPSPCRWLARASPRPLRSACPRARCPQRSPSRSSARASSVPWATPAILCPDGAPRDYPRYEIAQRFTVAEIMPGYKTPVFGYNGEVPGPTLRMTRGNSGRRAADEHAAAAAGGAVPERADAVEVHLRPLAALDLDPPARVGLAPAVRRVRLGPDVPGPGEEVLLPERQDARTLWYHDHGVHHTSQNAYNGLAGLYILHDEEEASLGIPTGAPGSPSAPYDVPMIVRDAMFATDGTRSSTTTTPSRACTATCP